MPEPKIGPHRKQLETRVRVLSYCQGLHAVGDTNITRQYAEGAPVAPAGTALRVLPDMGDRAGRIFAEHFQPTVAVPTNHQVSQAAAQRRPRTPSTRALPVLPDMSKDAVRIRRKRL